ncbi:MAG: MFS transporter [Roseiflexaceae bacterium]
MDSAAAERVLERHATRNFIVNVFDGGAFYLGMSLVSRYTVLPLIVERLSGERWMQGLIPMLAQTGWFLPGLFLVPFVASLPRRKPMVLIGTLFERLPFLLLGIMLLAFPTADPMLLLAAFFGLFAIHTFASGVTSIPWQDFIARIIPGNRWGIFFGIQSGFGGLLGVGGAAATAYFLATYPFPQSIGILSLLCFAAMVVSFFFLASSVEPPQEPAPRQKIGEFLQGVMPLLERDPRFRSYLISRAAIALGLLGHNFLTAAALERFNLPNESVALFTGALLGAQAVADLLLGWLADRWGHKPVLVLSTGLGLAALVLAVIAPDPSWYLPIFVLVGSAQAGYMLTGFTLVFSFSTSPTERPAYIGLANIAIAPVSVLGPLSAGWLAEVAGYNSLFVLLTIIGLAGMLMLHLRVSPPTRSEAASAHGAS